MFKKTSSYINIFIHYSILTFSFVLFCFAIWALFISHKFTFSLKISTIYILFYLVIFNFLMMFINHIIYLKGYDVKLRIYFNDIPAKQGEFLLLKKLREPPFTRTDGKRYLTFVHDIFNSKPKIESYSLFFKLIMISFYIVFLLQLFGVVLLFISFIFLL